MFFLKLMGNVMRTEKIFNLFNCVPKGNDSDICINYEYGFVIENGGAWAEEEISSFFKKSKLSGNDLNKTFHKSWKVIKNTPREVLLFHQIFHYFSTYGTNFEGDVYIPDEILNVPEIKLKFVVIKTLSKLEIINKCLNMLRSGIALKEETISDLFNILDDLDYKFTGEEAIKNKEAIVKLAEIYKIYPKDPTEFFRFVIYRATNNTLLIKNKESIDLIKASKFNPSPLFKEYGLEKMAQIFNRFKPLFLAFKTKCPKTINRIAKLSKTLHKPMIENPINLVTSRSLGNKDISWLNNATVFALFKAISACYSRKNGQDNFVYRVRNGKSWVQFKHKRVNVDICERNYNLLINHIKNKFNFSGKTIYIPKNVEYAIPTSEKMFVGNIPTGTSFFGEQLAAGVYWENDWGATDIDLSGLNINGKVGWNSSYNQAGSLLYSGDMTNARNGAVEYLWCKADKIPTTLAMSNVYYGDADCEYKIVVGNGEKINREYMMDPNKVFAEVKCKSVQKQSVIGMFHHKENKTAFTVLNFGAGVARVSSGDSNIQSTAIEALKQQWIKPLTLNEIFVMFGAKVVNEKIEKIDIDLSLENLSKESFTRIFV